MQICCNVAGLPAPSSVLWPHPVKPGTIALWSAEWRQEAQQGRGTVTGVGRSGPAGGLGMAGTRDWYLLSWLCA